jgi:PAS domain S-box-containing protein
MPSYWPIVAVFVAMAVLQASVAAVSIQMLSTVRAYVTGESLYSKGQKEAQIALAQYAEHQRESDYVRFMAALANPLGDRAAREALQRPVPDIAAARQGFLNGGSHPDDIDGLILMFRWFQHVPFMSRPISTWTAGDASIEEMRELAARAHERIQAGEPPVAATEEIRARAPALNERLTRLTSLFSFQLGEASRTTQRLLLALNACIAVLLALSGLAFVRRSSRLQAAAELQMERLIDAVTDGVVTVDDARRVVLFNRAAERMFEIDADAALGRTIDLFVAATDGSALALGPLTGELPELIGRHRDGSSFPAEASVSRLETEQGDLTTIVMRDVTAKRTAEAERRANEALEASNKAKTEFLSRMSHELRTPLNAVIGFSRLLRMDTLRPLSIEQLDRVRHVESAGAHLLALVNDVLDLSRIESGEMSVSTEAVPLIGVVEEASTMVSPLVTEAGVEVFLSADADVPAAVWVKADALRLRQVLVNLLSNAVKYNKPGGSVRLSWRVDGAECALEIVDTGRGIAPDQLKRLFEPFNRLGAETSSVEGTGIGLVLSRQLTEMMGGRLEITSVFGEGTCATLKLLVAAEPPVRPKSEHALRTGAGFGRPLRVLYAEDNEVNAELVRQLVTMRRAVTLRVATNGALALEMARNDPPDLMLVDMNLGDMTGIELARALQSDRMTRDVRLVALSADSLPEQIRSALAAGFESYMTKPIVFEDLLATLDKHSLEAL